MTYLTQTPFAALILTSLTLASCGKGTPEKAGERLGEQRCACERIGLEEELRWGTALIDVLTDNPTMTLDEARAKVREAKELEPHSKDDDTRQKKKNECQKALKGMSNEIMLDFPREEDRQIIENVVKAKERICDEEDVAAREELLEQIQKLEEERMSRYE